MTATNCSVIQEAWIEDMKNNPHYLNHIQAIRIMTEPTWLFFNQWTNMFHFFQPRIHSDSQDLKQFLSLTLVAFKVGTEVVEL